MSRKFRRNIHATSHSGPSAAGGDHSSDASQEEETLPETVVEAGDGIDLEDSSQIERAIDQELVSKLKAEAEENYDKYIRTVAELENIKKRALKEKADLLRYSGESLARDILEVVDNLERAVQAVPEGTDSELIRGVKLVLDQFVSILASHSILPKKFVGEPFDPSFQEAMCAVPTEEKTPGTVLEEFRKAYFLKDKLLRTAQVVVSSLPEGSGGEG